MDNRSWLWRRRSSEKSPGETESSGGSISSHSERFFDDQVFSNQISLSPEKTSKAELSPEELDGGVKALSEKLSAALMNISIKEDMVKQHSKVAEEAVEGWEKAEAEVLALRQQIEVLTLRNSTLEDRVCQLDGALKECLRQLRQTREDKDQIVEEVIEKKTSEWQITKTKLENQISDLHSQLQSAKKKEPTLTTNGTVEKENSALKLELASMAEELEIRYIERELSNQAAEQASKLHLESVKKVAKLETECRKLNAALRKALATIDRRSLADSQSSDDYKEVNEFESNRKTPSQDIKLMDDFLEMEKLVASPDSHPRKSVQNQTSEVEETLKKVQTEKKKLEITLNERENDLKASINELKTFRNKLRNAETKLVKMEALLTEACDARENTEKKLELTKALVDALQERVKKSEMEVLESRSQLDLECKERKEVESRFEDAYTQKNEAESRLKTLEAEFESLIPKVGFLETEVEKERALSGKMGVKCQQLEGELESLILKVSSLETEVEKERSLSKKLGVKSRELEGEISRLQSENQYPKSAILNADLRVKQDTELALAGNKFADCQKTIASLSRQLKTLATLEDFLIDTTEFSKRI